MATKSSRAPKQITDSAVAVVLHRLGDSWNGVAARRGSGGRFRILESRSFSRSDRSSLTRWAEQHSPGRVLIVVPASRIICRSFSLPEAPPDRLMAALELQAEAHLLGAIPAHRLGLAVLPKTEGASAETMRTGLLIGWPDESAARGTASIDRPLEAKASLPEPTFVADVAGLAALVDGLRPAEPVLWLDRAEGAVALAVTQPPPPSDPGGTPGVVFRATREEFADETEWRRDVVRVLGETLLSAGHSATHVRDAVTSLGARLEHAGGAALLAPDALRERAASLVDGTQTDAAWWDRLGIAVGTLLCLESELEPMTRMQAARTEIKPTPIARIAAALSTPRTATTLAILGLVLVALGPLALSRLRGAVLQWKIPDQNTLRKQNQEDAKLRAMYNELGRQTWPMSKLLADLANSTPEGVSVTSLVIDRGSGLRMEGVASAAKGASGVDRLGEMTETMNETGVFALADYDRKPGPGLEAVEFTVTAQVAEPFREYQWSPEQDFNVKSLAMRRFGKETTPGVEVPPEQDSDEAAGGSSPKASASGAARAVAGADTEKPAPVGDGELHADASHADETHRTAGPKRASSPGGPTRRATPVEGEHVAAAPGSSEAKAASDAPSEPPADSAAAAEGKEGSEGSRGRPDRRAVGRRGESDGSSGRASGAASRSDQPVLGGGVTIPDPISDEAIAAMSRAEAQEMLAKVSKARQIPDLDEATQARLKSEFDKLLARMKESK